MSPHHRGGCDLRSHRFAQDAAHVAPGPLRPGRRPAPIARTTTVRTELGHRLTPADAERPWRGGRFSAGWGTRGELEYHPVRPELVAEFVADTAVDAGRYRHPVQLRGMREDLTPDQLPPWGH
ncbi:hypothetical protein [Streptomyces sp. 142MFCol3.1]|uniref:hypothetical protein n=1 Tax=Streptomyces sp. 142MFCol3.1 TaxID=1172179 RepID=UPI0007C49638|nr:hypothetical protein [Streptomyces sp. 142MFCol3.1]